MQVLGIDPGLKGGFVKFDGKSFQWWAMPVVDDGKEKLVEFDRVHEILSVEVNAGTHVFLERAVSFGMGTKGAFNYGRGFGAIEIAIELVGLPVTYVEPAKWTKVMCAGISNDMKPKAKALVAAKRLFPKLVDRLPRDKKGKILDGAIDALLIASYGLRHVKPIVDEDFDFS